MTNTLNEQDEIQRVEEAPKGRHAAAGAHAAPASARAKFTDTIADVFAKKDTGKPAAPAGAGALVLTNARTNDPAGAHAAGAHAAQASAAPEQKTPAAFAKIGAALSAFTAAIKASTAEDKAAISTFAAKRRERAALRQQNKKPRRPWGRRERRRAAIIGSVSFVGLLVAAWGAGVLYFTFHFMPNTTIDNVDVSGVAIEDARPIFDERAATYTCSVAGKDYYILVPGSEIGFHADVQGLFKRIVDESNRWLWPIRLFKGTSYDFSGLCTWDNDALTTFLGKYTRTHNAGVTPPVDAFVAYEPEAGSFVVNPELIGKAYVPDQVFAEAAAGVARMATHVDLTDACLQMPKLYASDQQLIDNANKCNSYLGANFDLIVWLTDFWSQSGRVVDHIGNDIVSQWVCIDDSQVYFDEEAMRAWCRYYADSHYTLEAERTYTRPDGETITQDDGTYGWDFDRDILCDRMIEAILTGATEAVVVPCNQTAFVWADINVESDIGNTYVDVNIPTQVVRYIVDGEEVWRSPTVSGDIQTGQGTPLGVWYITRKQSPTHLLGFDPDGTPYDVPVHYWMAFIANSHGFHDNPNRNDGDYGPLWAFRLGGSHGCCNLPYPKAQALYSMIEVGCPVIVHWG